MLAVFRNVDLGDIRVIKDKNNEPLFCLSDICRILELQNHRDVKSTILREFGDGVDLIYPIIDALGRQQQATFIAEPQLYFLLMRSDKPKAKPFRQWVVNEVLPRIRKTGEYSLKQVLPKNYEEALEHLLAQVKENKKLQQERTALLQSETKLKRLMHSGLTYTSTQIAKELGLSSAKELHRILNIANIIYKSGGVWVTYARYTFEDDAKKILINKNEIINNGALEVYKTRWTQTGREFLLREWEKILRSVKGGENAENKRISRSAEEVG